MYENKGIDYRKFKKMPLTRWMEDSLDLHDAILQIEQYDGKYGIDFIIKTNNNRLNPRWAIFLRREPKREYVYDYKKPDKGDRRHVISDEGDLFHKVQRIATIGHQQLTLDKS